MNWNQYKRYLQVKIADAHYNMEYTHKKYKEAKAQHEVALRESEAFEKALDDLVERVEKDDL